MTKYYCDCGAIIDDGINYCLYFDVYLTCPNAKWYNGYKHSLHPSPPSHTNTKPDDPKIIGSWKK